MSELVLAALYIYVRATNLAMESKQTVGPKNDYYVTLQQLQEICKVDEGE
jgi:hypothetical protein